MKLEWTKELANSSKPLVIFDLDGTLFNVNYRHLEIFKRFGMLPDVRKLFSEHVGTLSKIKIDDFQYSIEATLNNAGIDRYSEHSAHFIKNVEQFWFKHFSPMNL